MKKQIMLERINRKEVLRYLGYKGISADATVNMLIDECEAEVIKAAVPRYTYRVTGVTQTADGVLCRLWILQRPLFQTVSQVPQ